jgi:hypothetical protein
LYLFKGLDPSLAHLKILLRRPSLLLTFIESGDSYKRAAAIVAKGRRGEATFKIGCNISLVDKAQAVNL